MINYIYDGELLKFNNKWKELHMKPFFIKEGVDKKEYITEIRWKDGEPIQKLVKSSLGSGLVIRKGKIRV